MKTIKLNSKVELKDFDSQVQLHLSLNHKNRLDLLMALVLLKENLIATTKIIFQNFDLNLKICEDEYSNVESLTLGKRKLNANISLNDLEYIEHYLLKFYRDGKAESEHIDVDFIYTTNKEVTLKISCDEYLEYSEDDIRKMIS